MKNWLRRLKGAIGMGLTWAFAWIPVGAVVAGGLWVAGMDPPGFFWTVTGGFGVMGFLGGATFSVILRLTEGSRRFDELSLPRFALWGGLGGLLLGGVTGVLPLGGPGLHMVELVLTGVAAVLGAGSAAGSLALARRAEDESLLSDGDDALTTFPAPRE